ncbi:MAG: hypothetical protein IID08_09690 [Candidatus Hydrogenedentes bacterium]|nr:hypothetical protein [Candidatus Hydrogenedentota bacterium]
MANTSTRALIGASIVLLAGCATSFGPPNLARIYNESAQRQHHLRNPIIVIPGLLGTRLVDSESHKVVWGAFSGDYADPRKDEDARLIAVPMKTGVPIQMLADSVRPVGVLESVKVRVIGLPIQLNAYAFILSTLGVGGYRDEDLGISGAIDYGDDHFTCFQFGYDWRLDNVENARRLHEFILKKREYVQRELKRRYDIDDADVNFDIVAHSMGGLLARYYMRYGAAPLPEDGSLPELTWAGAEHVERLILVGPPNAGSVDTLIQLTEGVKLGPFTPRYDAALLGTMPSAYQLLPRPRHRLVRTETGDSVDFYSLATWQHYGWGLASETQSKKILRLSPDASPEEARTIALDHLEKSLARAAQFHRALDRPASPPNSLALYLQAGDAVETNAVVEVNEETGKLRVIETLPGDGTVLRASALMDERLNGNWTPKLISPIDYKQVNFLFTDHLGLTRDPTFTDNVLYVLLEAPIY